MNQNPNKAKTFRLTPDLTSGTLESLVKNQAVSEFIQGPAEVTAKNVSNLEKSQPWMIESDSKVQHLTRLPVQLKHLLSYLGDTTQGESMNSICIKALTPKIEEMAKEAGLELPDNYGEW